MDGGVGYFCKDEWIHVDPEYYYVEYIVSGFAISHAIVAFFMVIAYYNLKVPLGIFKREKEVGRRVEFDGLYLSEQVTLPLCLSILGQAYCVSQVFPLPLLGQVHQEEGES